MKSKKLFILLIVFILFCNGCAAYKIQQSPKHNGGYVFTRSANLIPEYTVDEKNIAPKDMDLAKERFKRRWKKVEYYYRNMGYITGVAFSYWQYIRIFALVPLSPILVPIHAVKQYKYEHDPKYKEIVDKKDEQEEQKRRQKISELQEKLKQYIMQDIAGEEKSESENMTLKEGDNKWQSVVE